MFSSGSPVRSCWAELKYERILAVGGGGFELWPLKVQKNWICCISSLKGWQIWSHSFTATYRTARHCKVESSCQLRIFSMELSVAHSQIISSSFIYIFNLIVDRCWSSTCLFPRPKIAQNKNSWELLKTLQEFLRNFSRSFKNSGRILQGLSGILEEFFENYQGGDIDNSHWNKFAKQQTIANTLRQTWSQKFSTQKHSVLH